MRFETCAIFSRNKTNARSLQTTLALPNTVQTYRVSDKNGMYAMNVSNMLDVQLSAYMIVI